MKFNSRSRIGQTASGQIRRDLPWSEAARPPVRQTLLSDQEQPAHGSLRILLVEDNLINQRVMKAMLSKDGHSVQIADNGAAAVELFTPGTFDVVLMDVQMPIMDGYEATRAIRIREGSSAKRTPVIAVTALTLPEERETCLAAGMDDYLTKPITYTSLSATLRRFHPASPSKMMS